MKYLNKIIKRTKRVLKKNTLSTLEPKHQLLINDIRSKKITYLSDEKLVSIVETCQLIEERSLPGVFIEAGCALGGSSILLTKLKNNTRKLLVYDVFDMIPQPTEEDTLDVHERYKEIVAGQSKGIDGNKYYGYEENLYQIVQNNFLDFDINLEEQSVDLIKGLLQDTMIINEPVVFAHIDVDWYEPVITSLERIFPNLVTGGSIILDDYNDWGGCRKATDEYLRKVSGQFELDDKAGSLKITKKGVQP